MEERVVVRWEDSALVYAVQGVDEGILPDLQEGDGSTPNSQFVDAANKTKRCANSLPNPTLIHTID